jgi:hypothetical protein
MNATSQLGSEQVTWHQMLPFDGHQRWLIFFAILHCDHVALAIM